MSCEGRPERDPPVGCNRIVGGELSRQEVEYSSTSVDRQAHAIQVSVGLRAAPIIHHPSRGLVTLRLARQGQGGRRVDRLPHRVLPATEEH